jgi:hypothetical protein
MVLVPNPHAGAQHSSPSVAIPKLSSVAYSTAILGDAPALYYRLDESSGSVAADSSGHGRNAAYQPLSGFALGAASALVSDTDHAVTSALVVDSSSAGVPVGNADRSVEVWFRSSGGGGGLVSWGPRGTGQKFSVSIGNANTNKITVDGWGPSYVFDAGRSWADSSWHQMVVTYTGATTSAAVYLDGQLVGAHSLGGALATGFDSGGLTFGGGDGVNAFFGSLDEAAIYPSVLSLTQVQAHFAASGDTRPTAPGSVSASTAGDDSLAVSWTAATAAVPSGQNAVTGYLVTAVPSAGTAGPAMAVDGAATSATLRGLIGGASYQVRVYARNGFGAGLTAASPSVSATGPSSNYVSTVRADGPSLYYRLDEPSGAVAADSSGNAQDATYGGNNLTLGMTSALVTDPDLAATNAVVTNRYAQGVPVGNSDRTVEVWFRSTDGGTVVGWGPRGTGQRFTVSLLNNDQINVDGWGPSYTFTADHSWADNNWHQLVASYTGATTTAAVYLDGQLVGTHSLGGVLATGFDGYGLVFGAAPDCCSYFGSLDDAALYPTALSAAQVQAHWNASGDTRPTASGAVTATASADNTLSVSWTAATASVPAGQPPVTGYLITAMTTSGAVSPATAVDGSTTTAVLRGLPGQSSYTVTVQALNGFGPGPAGLSAPVDATGPQSSYAQAVWADHPSLFYRLDEPSGTLVADSSGYGRNGAYIGLNNRAQGVPGALAADPDLAVSNGLVIDRYPDGVPVGNADRTVEVWFRAQSAGTLLSWGPRGNRLRFSIALAGTNQIVVDGWNDSYTFTSPTPWADNSWHQLVVSYDGSSTVATTFLDGQTVGAHALPAPLATGFDSGGLTFGGADCCYLSGSILDEAAIYPTVLSRVQVANHFYAASGRSEGALS